MFGIFSKIVVTLQVSECQGMCGRLYFALHCVMVGRWQDSGKIKGYAHVDFDSRKAMQNAIKLDGKYLFGRFLNIDEANEKGVAAMPRTYSTEQRSPRSPDLMPQATNHALEVAPHYLSRTFPTTQTRSPCRPVSVPMAP